MDNSTQVFTTTFATLSNTTFAAVSSNVTTEKSLDFFDYANYAFFILAFVFVPPAFISQALLAYQIKTKKLAHTLSPILLINLGCWVYFLFTGFILRVYLMPTQGKPKNAYFMLYHGTIYIAGGQMVTISVFFLAFDRIVGMIAPAIHRKHQLNLVITTLTFVFIGFFFNVITVLIYQPVPPAPITLCDTIVCAQGKDAADIIYGTGICITTSTVCVGVVFNIILYRYWNTYNEGETTKAQFRRANYFVLVACLSEIFLRFIPQVLNYATFNIDPKWATFFAFLVTTSISADSAITAAFYRYMILKRVNEPKTRVVLLNSKTSAQQTMYTQTNQTS